MPTRQLVVIGTSSGGIEALRILLAALPADFPTPVGIVVHMAPQSPGLLGEILNRATQLTVATARNGERLEPGRVYVAPPDGHLVIEPGRVRVTRGPKENRFRPAIDPLFRSAAQVYGPGVVAVVLTGNLDDGTAGLWTVKQLGGTAIVQDPEDALFPSMPRSALKHVPVDHCVPLDQIAGLLVRLTAERSQSEHPVVAPEQVEIEVNVAKEHNPIEAGLERLMTPSRYACPECHGVLLQLKEAGRVRFRCHTGHAYSAESLLAAVGEGVEVALWIAIRALEEAALLLNGMGEHLRGPGHAAVDADRLMARAASAHRQAEGIRRSLTEQDALIATVSDLHVP